MALLTPVCGMILTSGPNTLVRFTRIKQFDYTLKFRQTVNVTDKNGELAKMLASFGTDVPYPSNLPSSYYDGLYEEAEGSRTHGHVQCLPLPGTIKINNLNEQKCIPFL